MERIVRARLQKETLPAPASSLRLQVTAITEARQWQLGLKADTGLGASLSEDPRTMTVLMAELSADIMAMQKLDLKSRAEIVDYARFRGWT